MMTPEELAEELKNLHYTEKLVLAQRLIEYAYDELGQLSSQLAPKRSSCSMSDHAFQEAAQEQEIPEPEVGESMETSAPEVEKAEKKPQRKTKRTRKTEKTVDREVQQSVSEEILSFSDLVSRLHTLQCKKESTLINAIIDLYKYRGEISGDDARKIVDRLKQKKIISIDENNRIIWN